MVPTSSLGTHVLLLPSPTNATSYMPATSILSPRPYLKLSSLFVCWDARSVPPDLMWTMELNSGPQRLRSKHLTDWAVSLAPYLKISSNSHYDHSLKNDLFGRCEN